MKFKRVFLTLILLMFLFPVWRHMPPKRTARSFTASSITTAARISSPIFCPTARGNILKRTVSIRRLRLVGSLSAQSVFSHILEFLKNGAETPLKSGAAIIAVILIAAAFSSAEIKSGAVQAAVYAAVTSAAANYCGTLFTRP